MTTDDKYKPAEKSAVDYAHAAGRGILGAIPFIGASAAEAFRAIIVPPLERRGRQWMETIGGALQELVETGRVNPEDLVNNDAFIDTVMQASRAAERTGHQEKLGALRNAVQNAALPQPPEDSVQQMFISYVDAFTVWHLRILALLDYPLKWFEARGVKYEHVRDSLGEMVVQAYPELEGKVDLCKQVLRELHVRGLTEVDVDALMDPWRSFKPPGSSTTDWGERFLSFITVPEDEEASND